MGMYTYWNYGMCRGAHKGADKDWYKKIDGKVIEDCCQLVKANSIKGNKQNDVTVVFTPGFGLLLCDDLDVFLRREKRLKELPPKQPLF